MHGALVEMQKGDILGHEFMGVVESAGPKVTKLNQGDRVVVSFQLAVSLRTQACTRLFDIT